MRLLLAEDEKALSRALTAILERSHYSVDPAFDGQEALNYLETEHYDGMILDIMMPKIDGITVLKEIRARGLLVPVLLLTARSELDDKVLGLDAGADDYLTKPFHTKELLARIRAMTRARADRNHAPLKLGSLTLDRSTFALSSPAGSLRLSGREFQMLELFMSSPKSRFSTEQLLESIWGSAREADSSIVRIYISYLQKKLDALHARIQIRPVKGRSYRLEEIP